VRAASRISWAEALIAAERRTWQGLRGHRATITSPEEDRFINTSILPGGGNDVWWLGGYQDKSAPDYREPAGGWRWVTGEPFRYTRWHAATGEPNDKGGEDVLDLAQGWGGDWNDESSSYGLPTYIVEDDPAVTPPAVPTGPADLTATVVSKSQINLAWSDRSHNETGFAVHRREGSGAWTRIALLGPNVTRFADLDLRPGVTYFYRVQAVNDAGVSQWSNEAAVTLPAAHQPVPLDPPSALSATAISVTAIQLTWRDTDGEAVYVVYRKGPGAAEFVKVTDVPANRTSYLDQGLATGTTYTYLVRGWHPDRGVSRRSNEAPTPLAQ
jgi:hypothetical protein